MPSQRNERLNPVINVIPEDLCSMLQDMRDKEVKHMKSTIIQMEQKYAQYIASLLDVKKRLCMELYSNFIDRIVTMTSKQSQVMNSYYQNELNELREEKRNLIRKTQKQQKIIQHYQTQGITQDNDTTISNTPPSLHSEPAVPNTTQNPSNVSHETQLQSVENRSIVNNENETEISTLECDEDVKMHQCDQCEKAFKYKHNVTQHIRVVHKKEKRYQCEMCSKAFYFKSDWTRHRRTHTGEKPYKCRICKKGFGQKYSLTVHKRIHTGERPYKCGICNKGFMRGNGRNRHQKRCKKDSNTVYQNTTT